MRRGAVVSVSPFVLLPSALMCCICRGERGTGVAGGSDTECFGVEAASSGAAELPGDAPIAPRGAEGPLQSQAQPFPSHPWGRQLSPSPDLQGQGSGPFQSSLGGRKIKSSCSVLLWLQPYGAPMGAVCCLHPWGQVPPRCPCSAAVMLSGAVLCAASFQKDARYAEIFAFIKAPGPTDTMGWVLPKAAASSGLGKKPLKDPVPTKGVPSFLACTHKKAPSHQLRTALSCL